MAPGVTLGQRLAAGPLEIPEALRIARQIAEALESAHEKGIIHRDLKPANIKITPDGRVKVLDFGLAKAIRGEGSEAEALPTVSLDETRGGAILGTAAYMSPEQGRGKPLDKRTDINSVSLVLVNAVHRLGARQGLERPRCRPSRNLLFGSHSGEADPQ